MMLTITRFLTVLLFVTITLSITSAQSQAEKAALEKTLLNYLEGGTEGDTARLIAAFHPSASMKFVDNKTGEFKDVPIATYLDNARKNAGKKNDRKTKILSYDIDGTAAQAKVEIDFGTGMFHDYFNLLKINGEWKIVSKIFYRIEKNQ
ncbi:MAG: nuclear transport factor 2 family protein [Saprospiraceae bacterium]